MALRTSEWIVVVYFAYLAGAAVVLTLPSDRRRHVLVTAFSIVVVTLTLARVGTSGSLLAVRDYMPLASLMFGYWLPASLVTATNPAFERTLLRLDHQWFGPDGLRTFVNRAPRALVESLEFAYLFCYPMVPAGFAIVYFARPPEDVDRFWVCVLLAAFLSYCVLPWLPTRPPRVASPDRNPARSRIKAANLYVLERGSIQLNTFPSGHAATSVAIALAVAAYLPWAGALLGLLALLISVGSIVGRYHYAVDVMAGVALAMLAFLVSRLA